MRHDACPPDLPLAAREGLVADVRVRSPELADALVAVLADHERVLASGFLDESSDGYATRPAALAGQRLGAYTLERPLGIGGMGAVWLPVATMAASRDRSRPSC